MKTLLMILAFAGLSVSMAFAAPAPLQTYTTKDYLRYE